MAWRQTAEFVCKYFTKGQMIALNGRIQARNYEDKNGNKRTAVEVVAENVHFCGSKNEGGPARQGIPYGTPPPAAAAWAQPAAPAPSQPGESQQVYFYTDDDLPF